MQDRERRAQRDPDDGLLWGTPYRTVRRLSGDARKDKVLAEEIDSGRRVVVDVLSAEQIAGVNALASRRDLGHRLAREAEVHQRLRHPNVVEMLDTGETPDGRPFVVFAWVPQAMTLSALLARGPLELEEALSLTLEIAAALSAAHALGIVHRDVRPPNVLVMLRPDGTRSIKLIDFGLAKIDGGAGPATAPGTAVLGAHRYLSPEMVRGQPVTAASDVYQWGLLLFECLTGKSPFAHWQSLDALVRAHVAEEPARVSALIEAPPALDTLVARALAKEPDARPPSIDAVADEVRAIIAQLSKTQQRRLAELGAGGTVLTTAAMLRGAADAASTAPSPLAPTERLPALFAPTERLPATTFVAPTSTAEAPVTRAPEVTWRRMAAIVAGLIACVVAAWLVARYS